MDTKDWYDHRAELQCDMIFVTRSGDLVKLDRPVPGDGTKWYVADWSNGWAYYDGTVEPSDLWRRYHNIAECLLDMTALLNAHEYKIVTAEDFDAATDKPDGLDARAALYRKDYTHVVYDPEDDKDGMMIWGSDPLALALESAFNRDLAGLEQ